MSDINYQILKDYKNSSFYKDIFIKQINNIITKYTTSNIIITSNIKSGQQNDQKKIIIENNLIPLSYLIYGYIYTKYYKFQLRKETTIMNNLNYEMYKFVFSHKNPIVKNVNIFFYNEFKKEVKTNVNNTEKNAMIKTIINENNSINKCLTFMANLLKSGNNDKINIDICDIILEDIEDCIENLNIIKSNYFNEIKNILDKISIKNTNITTLISSLEFLNENINYYKIFDEIYKLNIDNKIKIKNYYEKSYNLYFDTILPKIDNINKNLLKINDEDIINNYISYDKFTIYNLNQLKEKYIINKEKYDDSFKILKEKIIIINDITNNINNQNKLYENLSNINKNNKNNITQFYNELDKYNYNINENIKVLFAKLFNDNKDYFNSNSNSNDFILLFEYFKIRNNINDSIPIIYNSLFVTIFIYIIYIYQKSENKYINIIINNKNPDIFIIDIDYNKDIKSIINYYNSIIKKYKINKKIKINIDYLNQFQKKLIKDKNNFNISFKEVKNYNIKNKNFNIEKSDKERIKQKDQSNKIMYKENVDDLNNIKNFLYKTLSDNNTLIISYKNILLDIFNNIDINNIKFKINNMLDSNKINVDINTINNQILNIFNITDKDILNNFNLRNRFIYKINDIYNELNNINTITKNYIDKLNLNIDTYNKQITTFDIDINNFNKEIITMDGKIENLKSDINNIKNKINKFDKQIAAAKLSYKSATNQTEKNKFMLNISNIDQQKIEAENEREKNEEDLLKLEKIKTDVKSKIKNIEDDKKSIIVKITNDKNELNNKETLLKNINVNILNINNKSKLVEIYKYLIDNSKQINIKTEFEYFYNLISNSNSNSKNNISNLFLAQIITQPLFNKLSTYIENYKKEITNFIFNYNYDEINFNKILNFYQQKLDESNNKIKSNNNNIKKINSNKLTSINLNTLINNNITSYKTTIDSYIGSLLNLSKTTVDSLTTTTNKKQSSLNNLKNNKNNLQKNIDSDNVSLNEIKQINSKYTNDYLKDKYILLYEYMNSLTQTPPFTLPLPVNNFKKNNSNNMIKLINDLYDLFDSNNKNLVNIYILGKNNIYEDSDIIIINNIIDNYKKNPSITDLNDVLIFNQINLIEAYYKTKLSSNSLSLKSKNNIISRSNLPNLDTDNGLTEFNQIFLNYVTEITNTIFTINKETKKLEYNNSKNKLYFLSTLDDKLNKYIGDIRGIDISTNNNTIKKIQTIYENINKYFTDLKTNNNNFISLLNQHNFLKDLSNTISKSNNDNSLKSFADEFQKYNTELITKINNLLDKINKNKLKLIIYDILNFQRFNNIISNKYKKIDSINTNKDGSKINKKGKFILILPYTDIMFKYLLYLLIIVDFLNFFYQ